MFSGPIPIAPIATSFYLPEWLQKAKNCVSASTDTVLHIAKTERWELSRNASMTDFFF